MKLHALLVIALLPGCKGSKDHAKEQPKDPAGSATSGAAKPGAGSAAGPSTTLTAPHGIPLTGEALAKHYSECIANINAGKVEDVKQHCADPAITIHEVDFDDFQGIDVTLAYFETMRAAMPDWKISPQLILVSGRNIHAVNLVTGTHTGTLKLPDDREVKGTGNKVGLIMYQHLQTNDQNKTVEEWDYMDHHTLQDQLGQGTKEGEATRTAIDKGWAGAPIVLVTKDNDVEQTNLAVVAKVTEAFNTHKAADVAAMWADDGIVSDQASHADQKGKAAIAADLEALFTVFPDAKATTSHAVAAGDYVLVEGSMTGTHKGLFRGVKATNRAFDNSYAEIFKIQSGKVTELWRFQDGLAMTGQLTAPATDKAAPKGPAKP